MDFAKKVIQIGLDHQLAVAQHAVHEVPRRLVQHDQFDLPTERSLESLS